MSLHLLKRILGMGLWPTRTASARGLRVVLALAVSCQLAAPPSFAEQPREAVDSAPHVGRVSELSGGRLTDVRAGSQQQLSTAQIRLAQQPGQPPLIVPAPPAPAGANESPPTAINNADEFGPGAVRMPLMGNPAGFGNTPQPTPQVAQQFNQFVERTIDPENTFDLVIHRPRLLKLKQAPVRIQVADERVVNYLLITDREFSITGSTVGSTVLNLWFDQPGAPGGQKVLSYLVRVLPDPEAKLRLEAVYKALEDEINRNFPNSSVQLSLVGDKVVVRGEAKDIVEASQILQVVGANTRGGNQQSQGVRPAGGLQANQLGDVPLTQAGYFGSATSIPEAQAISSENAVFNQVLTSAANIINLLRVPGEQQVMLRVTVAEVNRTAARSIGMNISAYSPNPSANAAPLFPYVFQSVAGGIGTGNLPALLDNGQISLAINALRTLSLARSLAEPNLVTTNGQRANFQAGGEFPVPAASLTFGAVGQGVSFVPFGVSVSFIPYITDRDRIRLVMMSRVSTRDASLGTTVSGSSVPGLQSRTYTTTVELREGQTLAVAGLIQNNFGANSSRIPLFGDLPIIGQLAGSNSTSSAEQELMILVTPELVHPLEACQTPPVPGADVFEPGDVEFFLCNRLESRRNYDFRASVRTDWARLRRYERCEDQLIVGVQGRTYGCCDPYAGKAQCPTPATGHVPTEAIQPGVPSGPVLSTPPVIAPPPTEGDSFSQRANTATPIASTVTTTGVQVVPVAANLPFVPPQSQPPAAPSNVGQWSVGIQGTSYPAFDPRQHSNPPPAYQSVNIEANLSRPAAPAPTAPVSAPPALPVPIAPPTSPYPVTGGR
ncbi:MAG: pilus assembly protein N-terminal domain-containing protein [Planctomycetes bacterium]|nr:pilus assembly protein N-terminal domain-containing protein [Planctomycetota bacterium]